LDPKGVRILKDILFKLKNEGMTILLSTHIIALAEQICDKTAIINRGSVIAQGTNDDIKHYMKSDDKTLEDVFLRLTSTEGTKVFSVLSKRISVSYSVIPAKAGIHLFAFYLDSHFRGNDKD
ncbi:MAG: hypothetical protein L0956_07405, partial [Candidatus Mariimomonas ferrooxydans]